MKCDLAGLLYNAAAALGDNYHDKEMRGYYAAALLEVAAHVHDVRDGTHTLEEFADHYNVLEGHCQGRPRGVEGEKNG